MTPLHGSNGSQGPLSVCLAALSTVPVTAAPQDQPSQAVRDGLQTLIAAAGALEAEISRWAGVLEAQGLHLADGARSLSTWVSARTERSSVEARVLAHRARELRECPAVEAAYGSGVIGTAKVRALLAARSAHPVLFAEHEADLVATIAPLTADQGVVAVANWRVMARAHKEYEDALAEAEDQDQDQDQAEAEPEPVLAAADPAAHNTLHISRSLDDRRLCDLNLDAVTGAELEGAIAAQVDEMFRCGIFHRDDGLSPARRRSIAHLEIVRRGRVRGATQHGDPRPSVGVTIDARTLAGEPVGGLDDLSTRECGLDDGTPIDRRSVDRLLCNARVQAFLVRIGVDGEVETLGVTDLLRDATRRQRRALKRRDGGCVFPGCSAPPSWCQAHHLVPWECGGETLLSNLALLCSFHHHQVHEGGWRLWRHSDGRLHLRDPRGRYVPMVLPGHKVAPPPAAADGPDTYPRPPPLPPPVRFATGPPSG